MAQLVKVVDYISRYENDLTRYSTQYIRLKKYQWDRMKIQWENGSDHSMWEKQKDESIEEKKTSPFFKFLGFGKRDEEILDDSEEVDSEEDFGFNPNIIYNPTSVEQLRRHYLDQLFHFQVKWASSTLMDKSKVDSKYFRDSLLRSFTQQLPDNYFLFYHPVLQLKNARIELDILIVTPVDCMCITVLEDEDVTAFIGSSERFWEMKKGDSETKILNPLLSLDRMENIITGIFKNKGIDFPVRKFLISRNGYIDFPDKSFDLKVIDRRSYSGWFESLQKQNSPMKHAQFKATQAILEVGLTTAISRLFENEEE
ncbi:nuclease-related domain-containing protein [Sporosarcina sp. CAU 1771]